MMDTSTPILGFTGPIGSGCTYLSKMIPEISAKKYKYYRLSDIIRKILKSKDIDNPTVQQLQDTGNELRKEKDNGYLIFELLKQIEADWGTEDHGIIIDGIKNEGEVYTLRNFPFFYLFSVHADRETRCERVTRNGTFANSSEFYKADNRDEREEYNWGQQVKKCDYLSDIVIINNENIAEAASTEKRNLVRRIYDRYIKLIEDLREDERSLEICPTIDELCMTIAYSLSKSSSCLKRKVGALVIDTDKTQAVAGDEKSKNLIMPFVISSGYNEVPSGSFKCIFNPEYQKCYRDYLQEEYARKLFHCPKCGTKINIEVKCQYCGKLYKKFIKSCDKCKKEIELNYRCSGCGINVFDEYIPGGKESPGKMLDMCRALHAEEITLLKLAKYYGNSGNNLVLYVTTQPCNLCSNKIVSSGIKKVVYAEPYSMKESAEILSYGDVVLQRFEGIKSSAYFKLYQ